MPAYTLLRFHGPMLRETGRIALRALLSIETQNPVQAIQQTIPAPPRQLVDHYLIWAGAAGRYPDTLPAHMVAQWGLPLIAKVMLQTPYAMTKVLNQGITLQIQGDLPRGQALECRAFIASTSEENARTRISVTVQTGTKTMPNLVEATLHMVIVHHKNPNTKKALKKEEANQWQTLGSWSAKEHDGLAFALITGDFNPIHWSSLAGKMSALRRKVLQGFGTFARTVELIGPERIHKIDLRFLRPVPLPSGALLIEQAEQQEGQPDQIRLRGRDDQLHLAGTIVYRNPA